MKLIFWFLFVCTSAQAQQHHGDRPSVHGMLVVGKSKIYLSHLPMFHSPHDYQAIVEAEFETSAMTTYLRHKASDPETVYTLVPESFVLPEMIKDPKPFKAVLFKGHFERGGVEIAGEFKVTIKKVLIFKKFNAGEHRSGEADYYIFGNKTEQFMAHKIVKKPDFDHIVEIKPYMTITDFLGMKFPRLPNDRPVTIGPGTSPVKVIGEIYFETGDLLH